MYENVEKIIKDKLNETNLKTIIKIINLLKFITDDKKKTFTKNKIELIEEIKTIVNSEKYKIKKDEKNKLKDDIIKIRLNSILKTINYEDYKQKIEKENYTIYVYSQKVVIYKKNYSLLLEEDVKDFNYSDIIYEYYDENFEKNRFKKLKIKNFFKNKIKTWNKIIIKDL